jgi:hypothetical protein
MSPIVKERIAVLKTADAPESEHDSNQRARTIGKDRSRIKCP